MKNVLLKTSFLVFLVIAPLTGPSQADYVIRDGNNAPQTVKAGNCGGSICPQSTPADQTGAPFGTQTNPFYSKYPQTSVGNFGRITTTVCVTPTVTSATYAPNIVVGGLLTFPNLFDATGTGTIQSVSVNFTTAQAGGFLLYPFGASPTNASTWTDHSVAAISGATDIFLTRTPISLLTPNTALGTMTNYSAGPNLGLSYGTGSTNGYFILVPTSLTASLGGTANVVQVCVTVQQDL